MRTMVVVGISLLAILPSAPQPPDRSATLVSPGSPGAVVGIRDRCPTFLWGSDASTDSYELVVYELPREDSLVPDFDEAAAPALRIELPGTAPGWTCSAFNPLGSATVDVELYCVSQ